VTLIGTPDVQFAVPRLRVGSDLGDPPTDPLQTPAVPPPPPHRSPKAGRPDPTHGGAGDDPLMAPGPAVLQPASRVSTVLRRPLETIGPRFLERINRRLRGDDMRILGFS
jgi:hypothetical protein